MSLLILLKGFITHRGLLNTADDASRSFNSEQQLVKELSSSKLKCNTNLKVMCCDKNQIQTS